MDTPRCFECALREENCPRSQPCVFKSWPLAYKPKQYMVLLASYEWTGRCLIFLQRRRNNSAMTCVQSALQKQKMACPKPAEVPGLGLYVAATSEAQCSSMFALTQKQRQKWKGPSDLVSYKSFFVNANRSTTGIKAKP